MKITLAEYRARNERGQFCCSDCSLFQDKPDNRMCASCGGPVQDVELALIAGVFAIYIPFKGDSNENRP